MLASGAITSTPGVITSFSCIALLLLQPVPCARVAASCVETPRTPQRAAGGMTRDGAAPHGRLTLSLRKFHTTWGLRPATVQESWGWNRSGAPAEGRRPSQTERGVLI